MKAILFVLALLGAVVGRGQIVLDWYSQAAAATLLLDDYPNAAVAYSLRLLRSAYTGDCIEVRRASDNALQDIGFAGGVVDTAALKTFCASDDCYVRTWYDQSGNGYDLSQTTTTLQPRIVSSGVVDRDNGQPAPYFVQTADNMVYSGLAFSNGPVSIFAVRTDLFTGASGGGGIMDATSAGAMGGALGFRFDVINQLARWGTNGGSGGSFLQVSNNVTVQQLQTGIKGGGQRLLALDNTVVASGSQTGDVSFTGVTLHTVGSGGNFNNLGEYDGYIHEIVVWGIDQTSNRTAIETNMDNFYNIY